MNNAQTTSMRAFGTIATVATLMLTHAATAGDTCTPEWDNTIGTPGLSGGYVDDFETYDDGEAVKLYAIGSFSSAAGVPGTANLAAWNGAAWESVGGGLGGGQFSNSLEVFEGDLYAGGYFNDAGGVAGTAKLARWDGTEWHSLDAQLESFVNSVWVLGTWDDGDGEDLYIGGNYVNIGGIAGIDYIARWDGESFTELSGTIGGPVPLIIFDIENFDDGAGDALYVSGRFTTIDGMPANRIAKWNGSSWSALGSGITGPSIGTGAHVMEVWDDGTGEALYVGGQSIDDAGGTPVSSIAKWDGSSWTALGPGLNGTVWGLAVFDDGTEEALYVGGTFTATGDEATPLNRIAKWDGSSWSAVDAGLNDDVFGMVVTSICGHTQLNIGGSFSTANGSTANGAVQYGCPNLCPADIAGGDDEINTSDLLELLGNWGTPGCGAAIAEPADTVDTADLLELLGAWGSCP